MVQPTGHKAWKCVYSRNGAPRWLHIGDAGAIGLADARRLAARAMLEAAEGKDPVADRKAQRNQGAFAELAARYLETYAKRKNKSWQQAERLVRRNVLPYWGKLKAADITRVDVKAMMARMRLGSGQSDSGGGIRHLRLGDPRGYPEGEPMRTSGAQ